MQTGSVLSGLICSALMTLGCASKSEGGTQPAEPMTEPAAPSAARDDAGTGSGEPASTGSGERDAGSAPPSFPVECSVEQASASADSCELRGSCSGQEQRVTCFLLDDWRCDCEGGFALNVGGSEQSASACRLALGYCPMTIDQFECTLGELRLEEDLCRLDGACSHGEIDAGDPIQAAFGFHSYCTPMGDQWACVCSGVEGAYRFGLLPKTGESLADVCHPAVDVCLRAEAPQPAAPVECVAYAVSADETSCGLSALCTDAAIPFGDRQIAAQRIHGVRCALVDGAWACGCDPERETLRPPAAQVFSERSELPERALACADHLVRVCGGVFD